MGVELVGHGSKTLLQDAVELHGLARGQSNRAVGDVTRDLIERQPLVGRELAAGNGDAHHEDVLEGLAGE